MIESSLWMAVKDIAGYLWVPVGAAMTYVFKDYSQHKEKTKELEAKVMKLEIQYNDLKEDLTSIRAGIDKLIDHLLYKK